MRQSCAIGAKMVVPTSATHCNVVEVKFSEAFKPANGTSATLDNGRRYFGRSANRMTIREIATREQTVTFADHAAKLGGELDR